MCYFRRAFSFLVLLAMFFIISGEFFILSASSNTYDGFRSFANTDLGMIVGQDWKPNGMYSYSDDHYFMQVIDEDRFIYNGEEYVDYYIAIHQTMLKNRLSGNYGYIYRIQVSPGQWRHNWIIRKSVKSKEISTSVQLRTDEYQLLLHEPQIEPAQQSGSIGISLNTQDVVSLGFNYSWNLEELTVNTSGTSAGNRRYGAKYVLWDRQTSFSANDQYYYGLFVFSYMPDYSTCTGQSYYCYALKRPFIDVNHDITLHQYDYSALTPKRRFTQYHLTRSLLVYREANISFSNTMG